MYILDISKVVINVLRTINVPVQLFTLNIKQRNKVAIKKKMFFDFLVFLYYNTFDVAGGIGSGVLILFSLHLFIVNFIENT